MPTNKNYQNQKQIVDRINDSGNGPRAGLTANQAAARSAVTALAELKALTETIRIKDTSLASLNRGARQLANDDGLWPHAAVSDWITFENRLASAAAALYCAAQMRGLKLHQLAKARVELDAELRRARSDGEDNL